MCFLDAKKAFDLVKHCTLAKNQLDGNVSLHIVKLLIFQYGEKEFMVQYGCSLSMTFCCSNGIRQEGQVSPLLYNVFTIDLNHHLQATAVDCYVGCAWVNSLSYADNMVLLPTVTALQTLWEVCHDCHVYAGPHHILFNTMKTVCMRSNLSNHKAGTQQESGSEMRNLSLLISFVTKDMS